MSGVPMAGSFGKVWEALPGSSLERTQIQGIPEASADLSALPVQLC